MPVAEVAVLYPRSSWFHDNATGITGACSTQPAGAKCKTLPLLCIGVVNLYCASQAPQQCSTCLAAWPRQLAAAGCPAGNEAALDYCQGLGPAGPSSCEDQGATTWAPEFAGARIVFRPQGNKKHELVLSIEIGCVDAVRAYFFLP